MGSTKAVPKEKFNKAAMVKLLQEENDFVTNLLLICDVPYTGRTDENDGLYINQKGQSANRRPEKLTNGQPVKKEEVDEDVRTEIMSNKMKHKKNKLSERGIKKKEAKKAREQNKLKKTLVSAGKALKNGLMKQEKNGSEAVDKKPDTKLPFKPVYNSDGKLVFSKFDFAAGTTSLIKGKKKGQKSAEVMLDEIKKKDKQIKSLISSGDKAKALEIKSDMAWKKAFDKVEGKKVKDNVELLKKTIHKKEVKKQKSAHGWAERKQKEEHKLDTRIKRRNDNLNKRTDERKKKKVKKASKKGRVVGF